MIAKKPKDSYTEAVHIYCSITDFMGGEPTVHKSSRTRANKTQVKEE